MYAERSSAGTASCGPGPLFFNQSIFNRRFALVDFTQELRHRCRNQKCRMKLRPPVENEHHAFCTRGCHGSFYLKRCLVCERGIEKSPRGQHRLICKRAKCMAALRTTPNRYKWPQDTVRGIQVAGAVKTTKKVPVKWGLKWAIGSNRAGIIGPSHVIEIECGGWLHSAPDELHAIRPSDWRPVVPARPITDDLTIPEFLRRSA